jgi:hypothetical protein
MPGAGRARSLVCKSKKAHKHSHHGYAGNTRHSPRNGFNGFLRALPGDRACLPPSLAGINPANLTPASGRQDHTTSPSAVKRASSLRAKGVHRIPRSAFVTIAKRPSQRGGTAGDILLIWGKREAKYF